MELLQLICPVLPTRVEINSDYNYNRAKRKRKKESDTGMENSSASHLQERRSNRVSLSLGNLHCFFCTESDVEENLIAAGTYQAWKKKVNTLHLQQLGEKWLNWAQCLERYKHYHCFIRWGLDI